MYINDEDSALDSPVLHGVVEASVTVESLVMVYNLQYYTSKKESKAELRAKNDCSQRQTTERREERELHTVPQAAPIQVSLSRVANGTTNAEAKKRLISCYALGNWEIGIYVYFKNRYSRMLR